MSDLIRLAKGIMLVVGVLLLFSGIKGVWVSLHIYALAIGAAMIGYAAAIWNRDRDNG